VSQYVGIWVVHSGYVLVWNWLVQGIGTIKYESLLSQMSGFRKGWFIPFGQMGWFVGVISVLVVQKIGIGLVVCEIVVCWLFAGKDSL